MAERLRIAYFLDNFFPQVNGVVTSSINTVREMARRGHEVMGIVPKPPSFEDYQDDYFPWPVHFVDGFPAYFYPDFQFTNPFSGKVLQIMREFKPDIIHFHAPFTLGFLAIYCARKLDVPVVGTFHTFFAEPEYLSVVGLEKVKILQKIGWWFSNQFFERCDVIVSPAQATADIMKKNNLVKDIEVIFNGVEVEKYRTFPSTKRYPVEVRKNDEWMLYVGRISKEKCLDDLIDAAIIVINKRKNAKLLVVGDGPYLRELEKSVAARGFGKHIFFTGMIPNKDLLESGIHKEMKLFVTASTSENQPMTIIESIMFGLPIIGVDAKGVPELIRENGVAVAPNRPELLAVALIETLENKKLHKQYSRRSIEIRPDYDIRNTSDQMEGMYRRAIEEKKSVDIKVIN